MTTTALTLASDQAAFTPEQARAIAQLAGVANIPDAQMGVFFHQCKRTGLDPFVRQIYIIPRENRREGSTSYTIQISIDGLRLIADRAAERRGVFRSTEAPLLADPRTGQWVEVLPKGVAPLAVKMTVGFGQGRFTAVALLDEYMPRRRDGSPLGLWGQMPTTMLAKCAEAKALRMACPMDLSGLYLAEEMAQADAEARNTPAPASPSPSATPGPSGRVDAATLTGAAPLTKETKAALAEIANRLDAETVAKGAAWASGGQTRVLGELTEPQGQALLPELRKRAARAEAGAAPQYVDAEIITDPTTGEVHD